METSEEKPLSPELLQAIGKVSVNFSILESSVALGVWGLLGCGQDSGVHVTSGMPFSGLTGLFQRLATEFAEARGDTELAGEIRLFANKAAKAAERRNLILHSMWISASEPGGHPVRFKPWRKLPDYEEMPVAEVHEIADQIGDCMNILLGFIRRLPHITEAQATGSQPLH